LAIEELENGIHPSIHRNVLIKLDSICMETGTKILITTHSPSVVRHFDDDYYSSLYIGVPNENGHAKFTVLKDTEDVKEAIEKERKGRAVSIGEVVFDLLSGEPEDVNDLKGWLDV
jgi:ABC-type glutathione transport system ATPase component